MNWTVKLSSKAQRYYEHLDKSLRDRIKAGLLELSEKNHPVEHSQVKPLTGQLRGFYRLRVGDYRIIFSILPEQHIIAVVSIVPRGEAY
ncbi:MAG: type II toxin-antitoxin system RelE/ParE family toxin [Proteobacteria bacterium]|nr:type II toxin-antitoxin system RelE/ParE family toxin [Pseudomonadota bacterium]